MSPQELALIDSVGTSPCIFKLGDSFYDYTPIKLYHPSPKAPYFDGNPDPAPMIPPYEFVFGWCQHLDEISTDDLDYCRDNVFAARTDCNFDPDLIEQRIFCDPEPDAACTRYSGSDNFKDIETKEITGTPYTVNRWRD